MKDEDTLLEFPKGWTWTELGEITLSEKGKKPETLLSKKSKKFSIPYLTIEALEKGKIEEYTDGNRSTLSTPEDTLVVWDGARCGLAFQGKEGAVCSTIQKMQLLEGDPLYLYYFLKQKFPIINSQPKGTGTPHVNPSIFWPLDFPLPPLPEQHRITAKIEELFAKLDAGINELKVAMQRLKQCQIAVLREAMRGKLTEEWRGKQDQLTSVNEMLQIIQNEKKNWQNKGWRLKNLEEQEQENLPKLPEVWIWKRLGNICYTTSGGTPRRSNKEYFRGDIPWLKSGELNDGIVAETEERIMERGLEESNAKLFPAGTLLIALYGATAGKLGILGIDSATNQAICAIFIPSVIETRFLYWYLFYQRNELLSERFGGAQPNLSQTMLNKQYIPLPPIEEQQKIVEEIDQKLSLIEESENIIQQNLKRSERFRQSILKKAFEGKLVPQDPSDEPAEKLLEQIKAEKVKQEVKKS